MDLIRSLSFSSRMWPGDEAMFDYTFFSGTPSLINPTATVCAVVDNVYNVVSDSLHCFSKSDALP